MNVNDLVNQFKSAALSVGEFLTPVLRESKFKETGVLTPEEYVAGSYIRTRDYLPADKQFLVTRQVPCHQRCAQMMNYDQSKEKIIREPDTEGNGIGDSEWVDTHHFDETKFITQDLDNENVTDPKTSENNRMENEEEDDETAEAFDLDEYEASGALEEEDPGRYVVQREDLTGKRAEDEAGAGLMRSRRYDLHITYDKYYQVPRFWLVGYDENGTPLTVDKMKEDFSQEHADRTITLESHPHIAGLTLATIHPCRHAAVMKRLIEQFQENGKELSVLDYIFVFLKFVQAVIPTVEYDYTRSIRF